MQNYSGTFRTFFATLAAAAFLALTLSSCAVTVALPGGGSTTTPITPPMNTGSGTIESPKPEQPEIPPEDPDEEDTEETPNEEPKEEPKEEDPKPAPSPAKWSENGTTLIGYVFPEDFNGTLVLPTDRSYAIATSAFSENKTKIKKLVVPSNVVEIKMFAFKECPYLTEVVFEGSSTILGKAVFQNCNNLLSVTLPQQLKDIPAYLFSGCTQLNTINLSENLQTIGMSAFEKCFALRNITFPETLKVIGSYAFQNAGLTSIDFPKHISKIGEEAFLQNQDLQSIEFAVETGSVELGDRAFYRCINLKTVILRGKITSLPSGIFVDTVIETLCIPATTIDISETAFDYSTPPKTIYFAGTQETWNSMVNECWWLEDLSVKCGESAPTPAVELLSSLLSIFL